MKKRNEDLSLKIGTYNQWRCQSKRSEGALAKSWEALNQTELLHIKTDIQILYGYKYA